MHPLNAVRNIVSRLGAPFARAVERPYIEIHVRAGHIFLSDVTEDLNFFVLSVYASFTARNESPVATTIRLRGFDLNRQSIRVERAVLNAGSFGSESDMVSTMDISGGRTFDGVVLVHLQTEQKLWPNMVDAELRFEETYGTRIKPAKVAMSFSPSKPPSGPFVFP